MATTDLHWHPASGGSECSSPTRTSSRSKLGFAVADRLGFGSLAGIGAARYPLRVSVRGSLDAATSISVDVVLRAHGLNLDDITAWGGTVSYDQPMPMRGDRDRIGRLAEGEIDAVGLSLEVRHASVIGRLRRGCALEFGCPGDHSAKHADHTCRPDGGPPNPTACRGTDAA
jgi:hypothetical protein